MELTVTQSGEGICFEVDDTNAVIKSIGDKETSIWVQSEIVHAIEAAVSSGATIA